MTHPSHENTPIREALEALLENGLDGMPKAMQILFNEAMKVERAGFLRAGPSCWGLSISSPARTPGRASQPYQTGSMDDLSLRSTVRSTTTNFDRLWRGESGIEFGWQSAISCLDARSHRNRP